MLHLQRQPFKIIVNDSQIIQAIYYNTAKLFKEFITILSMGTVMEKATDSTEQPNNDEDVQPFEPNDSTACNGVIYFANLVFFFHSPHCFLFTPRTQLWN